jgi:hypothetical protein
VKKSSARCFLAIRCRTFIFWRGEGYMPFSCSYVRKSGANWVGGGGGVLTEKIWNSWEEKPQLILSFLGMRSVSADRFFLFASSWHIAEKRSWVVLKLSLVCMFVCFVEATRSLLKEGRGVLLGSYNNGSASTISF